MLLFTNRRLWRFASQKIYKDSTKLSEEDISRILFKEEEPTTNNAQQNLDNQVTIDTLYEKSNINELLDIIQKKAQQEITPKEEPKQPTRQDLPLKYGLPIKNVGLDLTVEKVEPPKTVTMKMFDILKLNEHTSYQEYENAIQQFKEGLYGNAVRPYQEVRNEMKETLKEDAIPYALLNNNKYMEEIRENRALNISIPGTIENEHAHRFLKLRPVEEFRHTPLIPISDRQMREYQEKVEAYHRKGVYLEVSREQLYFASFVAGILYIMFRMFQWVLKKEEESGLQFQRLKLRRMGMAYEVV
ncbi:unnamed protein product [Paramecium octaurelia]|uniref:Uncharacterized protein n=1 Tax=Paramecium octaurelia TaxID=43137 RepID=A0A8S1W7H1_PAROT|nr:unnamed protein product [Paramecium octaurelia]